MLYHTHNKSILSNGLIITNVLYSGKPMLSYGQLPGKSPEKKKRRDWDSNQCKLAHLTCLQVGRLSIKWDDIILG